MNATKPLIDRTEDGAEPSLPPGQARGERRFSEEELRIHTAAFLEWHRKEYGVLHQPTVGDVREWARLEGIDPAAGEQLFRAIHQNAAAIIREAFEIELPPLGERKPQMSWTDFLVDLVRREKEMKAAELLEEQPHRAEADRREREERQREEVRSALIFRPLSCDSTAVKDLEWRLTTGNIPSEEVQSVISFLNQLCRKQSGKCSE